MSTLEETYKLNIGKLFVWEDRIWTGQPQGWTIYKHLVMPYGLDKRGGWWHYQLEVVKPNIENAALFPEWQLTNRQRPAPCKEFGRKSVLASLSLLGDTPKTEVA